MITKSGRLAASWQWQLAISLYRENIAYKGILLQF
jgi:hypothetical protein